MFTRICVSPNYHISSTGFKNRVTYLCFLIKLNIILSDVSKCWHLIKIVLCSLIQDLESSKSEYTFQIINVCVRVCIVNKFWSRNQKENFCESRAWCPPHSDIKGPLVYNLTYGYSSHPCEEQLLNISWFPFYQSKKWSGLKRLPSLKQFYVYVFIIALKRR